MSSIRAYLIAFLGSWQVMQAQIPVYSVTVCKPQSEGVYFIQPLRAGPVFTGINMILDREGKLIYYKKFPENRKVSDFKLLPNGWISYYYKDKFYLMDSSLTVKDSIMGNTHWSVDPHDLQVLPNGNFLLLALESYTMDLTAYNYFKHTGAAGSSSASVWSGIVVELNAKKEVVFEWHAKDHYDFSDIDPFFLFNPAEVPFTHFNSITVDGDGNYIVSARHLNEITKISKKDGSVIWRLGGKKNQFTFFNDDETFLGQHDARILAGGNLSVYDNGRRSEPIHPAQAREYKLDQETKEIQCVWKFIVNPNDVSARAGNIQELSHGKRLINYGGLQTTPVLTNVVTLNGEKLFELVFKDSLHSYRAFNYPKLPWTLKRPVVRRIERNDSIFLQAEYGFDHYLWSTGEKIQTISVSKTGEYFVLVPVGDGGYLASDALLIDPLKRTHRRNHKK